jgi:hypothetical protein
VGRGHFRLLACLKKQQKINEKKKKEDALRAGASAGVFATPRDELS